MNKGKDMSLIHCSKCNKEISDIITGHLPLVMRPKKLGV